MNATQLIGVIQVQEILSLHVDSFMYHYPSIRPLSLSRVVVIVTLFITLDIPDFLQLLRYRNLFTVSP